MNVKVILKQKLETIIVSYLILHEAQHLSKFVLVFIDHILIYFKLMEDREKKN